MRMRVRPDTHSRVTSGVLAASCTLCSRVVSMGRLAGAQGASCRAQLCSRVVSMGRLAGAQGASCALVRPTRRAGPR